LLFTCLQTLQAKWSASSWAGVGARRVTTFQSAAGSTESRSWTSTPPETALASSAARGGLPAARAGPASSTLRFFFAASASSAPLEYEGAITASRNVSASAFAVPSSTSRLSATIPPNALTSSAARATR
jgi:hypothetical protein